MKISPGIKNNKKYKFLPSSLVIFSIFIIFVTVFLSGVKYFSHLKKLRNNTIAELSVLAKSRQEKISQHLLQNKIDALNLSQRVEVHEMLKQKLQPSPDGAVIDVERYAVIASKELDNFLRNNPQKTLKDLTTDKNFVDIAVQPIGKNGYSMIEDADKLEALLTISPKLLKVNLKVTGVKKINDALSSGTNKAEDFYLWRDPDGVVRNKYAQAVRLSKRTADGIGLAMAATAYINDYKEISSPLPSGVKFLSDFKNEFDYQNILLISPDNYVVYMVNKDEMYASNLFWLINKQSGLTNNLKSSLNLNSSTFFGPYFGEYGYVFPRYSIITPVYEDSALLGYVGIVDTMDDIYNIVKDDPVESDSRETYLINNKNYLISPLLHKKVTMFVQTMATENTQKCFNSKSTQNVIFGQNNFLNYLGNPSLGVYYFIPEINWCLLSEQNSDEITLAAQYYFRYLVVQLIVISFSLFLLNLLINKLFFKKRKN